MFPIAHAALALALPAPSSSVVYVDASAPGPGDGTLANPFVSIQQAVAAPTTADSSQISVAPGEYWESIDLGARTMSIRSTGGPEVTIVHAASDAPILLSYMPWFVGVNISGFTFTRDGLSSPNVALRPDAACVTRERFAAHSAALTPHCAAAAAISISFAAAPATRIPYSPVPRTAVEPPVTWKPNHSATL